MLDSYAVAGITIDGGGVEVAILEDDLLRPTHAALLHAVDAATRAVQRTLSPVGLDYTPVIHLLAVASVLTRAGIGYLPIAGRDDSWVPSDVFDRHYASCRIRELLTVTSLVDPHDVKGRLRGLIRIGSTSEDQSHVTFHLTDASGDSITGHLKVDLRNPKKAKLILVATDPADTMSATVDTSLGSAPLAEGLANIMGRIWAWRKRSRTPAVIVHPNFQTPPEIREYLWFWEPLARADAWARDVARYLPGGPLLFVSPLMLPCIALHVAEWAFGRGCTPDLETLDLDTLGDLYAEKLRDLEGLPPDILSARLCVTALPDNTLAIDVSLLGKTGLRLTGGMQIRPGTHIRAMVVDTLRDMWASTPEEKAE